MDDMNKKQRGPSLEQVESFLQEAIDVTLVDENTLVDNFGNRYGRPLWFTIDVNETGQIHPKVLEHYRIN